MSAHEVVTLTRRTKPPRFNALDSAGEKRCNGFVVVTTDIGAAKLAELVRQVQAGHDVILTEDDKPVARLISADEASPKPDAAFHFRSFQGHQVLAPVVSQSELANEMFSQ